MVGALMVPSPGPQEPELKPVRYCVLEERPAYVHRLAVAIARWEGCKSNPGCIKFAGQKGAHLGRGGYAEWNSRAEGFDALCRYIEKRMNRKVGDILRDYNRANPRYAEIILAGTGLDPNLVIQEKGCGEWPWAYPEVYKETW